MVSKKESKKKIFLLIFFINFIKKRKWYWEKRWLFSIGNGVEIGPLEMGRKSPDFNKIYIADPYEILHNGAFILGLPCLPWYPYVSIPYTKG